MILFFHNDFGFSETDGERKAGREISSMEEKGGRKCNMVKDFIWANYD